ncbi:hypothetical protein [Nonomuraea wenchangensis]|uniref:Tetratricopeptide repeat-containing protein n=1 Tax=Nonomuraea wenchangensis TaxID=568860 RepID=A0A1I0HED0_9ACTN|nr:hypothetical protein [Nonomuraea wenchangensis]SET82204.1 hypothetical protein SAMN05421811_104268 [Nonomuraea wenchangensis]
MGGGRWRESRVLVVAIALTVIAAVPAVLTATKVTNPWILGGAAAGAAIVLVLAGIWQDRYKKIVSSRDDGFQKLRDECLTLRNGAPPKVRKINDPIALGIHPSIPLADHGQGKAHVPPYIMRDVDTELRSKLEAGGFVLIVGDSTAGKSRAAFEAMRHTLRSHTLIAPRGVDGLRVAIAHASRCRKAVLWLNDLEFYLRPGGLSKADIARLIIGNGSAKIILATIRSAEQARLLRGDADPDGPGRQTERDVREVFEQAHQIRMWRKFSHNELDRARALTEDPRIAMALRHSDTFGVTEYLAAGPALQCDYENAWDIGVNPRGAALVSAAIDCRRAGFLGSIPRALLNRLHEIYLNEAGGNRLMPESIEHAWEWATRPRYGTTALLVGEEAVDVFDYLVDLKQHQEDEWYASEEFVKHALAYAGAPDSLAIGEHAYWGGALSAGKIAFRRALMLCEKAKDAQGQANALKGLGDITYAEGDYADAAGLFQRAWALYDSIKDSDGKALVSRSLGAVAADSDKWVDAAHMYIEIDSLFRSVRDGWGCAHVSNGLADLLYHKNDYGPHTDLYQTAERVRYAEIPWALEVAMNDHKRQEGDLPNDVNIDQLTGVYTRISKLYGEMGDWAGQGHAVKVLGAIAEWVSDWDTAVGHYEKAWGLYRKSLDGIAFRDRGGSGRSAISRYCDMHEHIASSHCKNKELDLSPFWGKSEEHLEMVRDLHRAARNVERTRHNLQNVIRRIELMLVGEDIRALEASVKSLGLRLNAQPTEIALSGRLSLIVHEISNCSPLKISLESSTAETDISG